MPATGTIKSAYDKRIAARHHYVRRARQAARYTVPSLFPEEGMNESKSLYTPYQGLGQRGLNNLSSKLLLILMPPDQPMFKLDIDDFAMQKLVGDNEAARGELDEAFGRIERAVATDLAATQLRSALGESLKQLLIAGNVVIFQEDNGDARVFRLDQFVVTRDPQGHVMQVIVKEMMDPSNIPANIREHCGCGTRPEDAEKPIAMYTRFWREDGKLHLIQEINKLTVPGSSRQWPVEKSPLIVPTTNRLPGEDYGRGYIETTCLGDLISFEGLSKSLLEGAAMAAKVLWMRNPNSTTRAKDLEKPNGSVINGNPNDVGAMRLEKGNDFNFALNTANGIEKRLEQVFLLNQSVQRQGERVTATEIQFVAQDIEDALGNLYTDLAGDLQLPIVNFQLARLTRKNRIPRLPKGIVKPRITTGLSALGRGQDLRKMQSFISDLQNLGGEQAIALVQQAEMVKRLGAAHGIDTVGLIKTEEQVAAEAQAAQQQARQEQMMNSPAAAEMAKVAAPMIAEQMSGESTDQ